ncbi:MAG: hypothetical protein BDTLLHRC_000728 [Candidatus Fervidibacter sp.]
MLPIIAVVISILSIFFYFISFYNITLTNKIYTYVSLQMYTILIFYVVFIILYSINLFTFNKITDTSTSKSFTYLPNLLRNYLNLIKIVLLNLSVQYSIIVLGFILILLEINILIFLKMFIFVLIVVLLESMLFYLILIFYNYRWLIVIVYGGTILLSPLIAEAMNFLREPWMRSVLEFWSWVVPFQVISGAQSAVLAEGWQQMDLLLGYAIYTLIYCFIVTSICLYTRQLQTNWVPYPLRE